jgi:hypothetical protein
MHLLDISLTGQIKLKAKITSYSEPAAPTSMPDG